MLKTVLGNSASLEHRQHAFGDSEFALPRNAFRVNQVHEQFVWIYMRDHNPFSYRCSFSERFMDIFMCAIYRISVTEESHAMI